MKTAIAILTVFAIAALCLLWLMHPWTPEGRAIALGKWQFGEHEFQVWQRKTQFAMEPFADGLFVRRGTNSWAVFCFDIQDRYSPRVSLEREGAEIVVYRDREKRGKYDLATETFCRHEEAFTPVHINGDPPGEWWLRKKP
jgi:hypothetical protein